MEKQRKNEKKETKIFYLHAAPPYPKNVCCFLKTAILNRLPNHPCPIFLGRHAETVLFCHDLVNPVTVVGTCLTAVMPCRGTWVKILNGKVPQIGKLRYGPEPAKLRAVHVYDTPVALRSGIWGVSRGKVRGDGRIPSVLGDLYRNLRLNYHTIYMALPYHILMGHFLILKKQGISLADQWHGHHRMN